MSQVDSPSRSLAEAGVCQICHRVPCTCDSHAPFRPIAEVRERLEITVDLKCRDEAAIERAVNEALHFYYNRDAMGLAKWLRGLLTT
jgi:hypothetical protein